MYFTYFVKNYTDERIFRVDYKPRIIEKVLESGLKRESAVLVEGTKACGKTTTCKKYAKSNVTLDDALALNVAENNPNALLTGLFPT